MGEIEISLPYFYYAKKEDLYIMLVGNYIHYRFSNYREYGLGLNSGVSPNPNRVFAN